MSKICQVTGRKPAFGNNVSHSHRKTRRRWNPNIQNKRFWVPNEKRWVTLTVSARGIKTINKNGSAKGNQRHRSSISNSKELVNVLLFKACVFIIYLAFLSLISLLTNKPTTKTHIFIRKKSNGI